MELTAWQKICHRLLGRAFKKRARNDQTLSEDLVKGNIPIMPEVYMAQVFRHNIRSIDNLCNAIDSSILARYWVDFLV